MNPSDLPINILIIEDLPEGLSLERISELNKSDTYFKYLVDVPKEVKEEKELKIIIDLIIRKSQYDKLNNFLSSKSYDIAILDYYLEWPAINENETGWMHMPTILKKNNHCKIILVTTDEKIDENISTLGPEMRDLISERPNVIYISKSLPQKEFNDHMVSHIKNKVKNIKRRRELQNILVECAIESYKRFMGKKVAKLIEPPLKDEEGLTDIREKEISTKEDTLNLDLITEDVIKDKFKPLIHSDDIVICTEELGIANKLIYRVHRPKFYIFSDPLDGSSAIKAWINETSIKLSPDLLKTDIPSPLYDICKIDKDSQYLIFKKSASEFTKRKDELLSLNQKEEWKQSIERLSEKICDREKKLSSYLFKDLINDNDEIASWKERYGPIELNVPMISIVLAERHQVVSNVIVNLFTGDIYKSDDTGNYKSKIDPQTYTVREETWEKLRFRDFSNEKLFICTLKSKTYKNYIEKKKGKPQDFQFLMHFRECIQSFIPSDYDLAKSFEKRKQRHDFTPGPGRILFLTEVAEEYSHRVEDSEKELYSCILSSGEPLTEWVGWFAFLRHVSHISAYCLRTGSGKICQHQIQRANIKGTMIPPEVASLFKSGMMDFEVLHTGYRGAMHNYTDSIVVFFNEDKRWKKIVERKLEDRMPDTFVKIET